MFAATIFLGAPDAWNAKGGALFLFIVGGIVVGLNAAFLVLGQVRRETDRVRAEERERAERAQAEERERAERALIVGWAPADGRTSLEKLR